MRTSMMSLGVTDIFVSSHHNTSSSNKTITKEYLRTTTAMNPINAVGNDSNLEIVNYNASTAFGGNQCSSVLSIKNYIMFACIIVVSMLFLVLIISLIVCKSRYACYKVRERNQIYIPMTIFDHNT